MLSVGVLTLVGVHRLRRLRSAGPRARVPTPTRRSLTTERALRTIGADERLLRVDIAIRAAASQLSDRDRRILAVMVDDQGAVEIALSGPCPADEPFTSTGDRWQLAAATATESLCTAARPVGAPCVGLVQLGVTTPDATRSLCRSRSARDPGRRCRRRPGRRRRHRDHRHTRHLGTRRGCATGGCRVGPGEVRRSPPPRWVRLVRRRVRPRHVAPREHGAGDGVDVRAALADGRWRGVGTGDRARGVRLRERGRGGIARRVRTGARCRRRWTSRGGVPRARSTGRRPGGSNQWGSTLFRSVSTATS